MGIADSPSEEKPMPKSKKRSHACAKESCDDFIGCTIDAGVQCAFGI
ncbi:hypothetical protein ENSA5_04110 [Enhygromyxa salina]|uniref:Uncharacterized protein n=1 Tax=Enhygromyxa salina TaxID=215803 RepID=A0A2S9YJR9_9BACT|nr:hypothetical protein ENSA5_04110 [Enhygromyxa salina]